MSTRKKRTPTKPKAEQAHEEPKIEDGFPPGFEVVDRVVTQTRRDGSEVIVERGHLLQYTVDGATYYAGKLRKWEPKPGMIGTTYPDHETARISAWQAAESWKKRAARESHKFEIRESILEIPIAVNDAYNGRAPKTTQVQWRATLEESEKLELIRLALRQNNVEVAPGRPIVSNADVLRHIFSLIEVPNPSAETF
jgi:hypothetical protein